MTKDLRAAFPPVLHRGTSMSFGDDDDNGAVILQLLEGSAGLTSTTLKRDTPRSGTLRRHDLLNAHWYKLYHDRDDIYRECPASRCVPLQGG
jgi:hypothetical protein